MPASSDDLIVCLECTVQELKRLKEADKCEIKKVDLVWDLLATIEDLFLQLFDD